MNLAMKEREQKVLALVPLMVLFPLMMFAASSDQIWYIVFYQLKIEIVLFIIQIWS